ncbi:MAG: hypothetical protein ACTSRA_07795 [Promethearchaeota archaeon]
MDIGDYRSFIRERSKLNNLSSSQLESIFRVLESRAEKIQVILDEGCVFKYTFIPSGIALWIVLGKDDEYLIHPLAFCSCHDFYINVVLRRKEMFCYHLVSQFICHELNRYREFFRNDSYYTHYMQYFFRN